jgi:MFS family permease
MTDENAGESVPDGASEGENHTQDSAIKPLSIPATIAFGLIACVLYGLGAGMRSDIGILLSPLAAQCGIEYADASLCVAVMQLVFGGTQPLFGMLASRKGNRFVLLVGVVLTALGLLGMAGARSYAMLMLSLGIVFGAGVGALGFGLVLTSAIYFVGPKRAMMISGMLNAAAGLMGFGLSPALQSMLSSVGTSWTLMLLLVPVAVLVPVTLLVTSRDPEVGAAKSDAQSPSESGEASAEGANDAGAQGLALIDQAFRNRTFRLLVAGFTTCGFHMVIIESHLFNQFVQYGIPNASASWAYSVYGIATIFGALLSGWLSSRLRKGRLLGFYYGFRAVWVVAFLLLMPKTLPFAILFAVGLGLTGDATVSPTSGLVHANFSLAQSATLIGVLFFCHQVGAFLSAWLGGVLFDLTGGYVAIWAIDVAACAFASVMSNRIREQ